MNSKSDKAGMRDSATASYDEFHNNAVNDLTALRNTGEPIAIY